MRKLVWGVVAIALAIWSGIAWLIHGLIGFGGGLAANNADIVTPVPEAVEWLSWFAHFGTGVGEWIVVIVWAIGALVLLVVGFAGTRLMPRLSGGLSKLRANA